MISKLHTHTIAQRMTVAFLAALMILTPFVSFAQETDGDSRFCSNLDRIENKLFGRLGDRTDAARDTHQEQIDRYSDKKTDRIGQLHDRRDAADAKWNSRIDALRDRADTDEQEKAIEVFVATVKDLVIERREAVDEAIDIFEEAAKALRDERSIVFNEMVDAYKADIEGAFDTAKRACEAGEDSSEVRAQLRSDLTDIREAFKADREQYTFRADFRELQKERKEAVAAAREVFREGFARAKEILREAFAS